MIKFLFAAIAILAGCTSVNSNAFDTHEYREVNEAEFRIYTDDEICWEGFSAWQSLNGSLERKGADWNDDCGYGYYKFPVIGDQNYRVTISATSSQCGYWYQPTNNQTLMELQLYINNELVDEDVQYITCDLTEYFEVAFPNP